MQSDEGHFPTTYLRLLASERAARPGDSVSMRIEGTGAGSLTRGKVLGFQRGVDDRWEYVGVVIACRTPDERSTWMPAGSQSFAVTLEGYPASRAVYFDVPEVEPGEYRVRLDAHARGEGPIRERTATLYASLLVLPSE